MNHGRRRMITRIELTNFMSHKHTVIEPAAGLTVLVGRNNVGKSAVVTALQILCHNDKSTYVTRHGERECSVIVHTNDGHEIQWRRKKSPAYVIDGEAFDRLGQNSVPDELHRALRMAMIEGTGNDQFDIHFGLQKTPIFLVGDKGAAAARFFASSSDAIRLVEMQKRHKDKHAEKKREKTRLERLSEQLNAELNLLQPVVPLEDRLVEVEQTHAELLQLENVLAETEQHCRDLRWQGVTLAHLEATSDVLSSASPPPTQSPTAPLEQLLTTLRQESARLRRAEANTGTMRGLTAPPQLFDTASLARLAREIDHLQRRHQQSTAELETLAELDAAPVLANEDALAKLSRRLSTAYQEVKVATGQSDALQVLPPPPVLISEGPLRELVSALSKSTRHSHHWQREFEIMADGFAPPLAADTRDLENALCELNAADKQFQGREDDLKRAASDLTVAGEQLRAAASENACPVCGAELDPDRVVEMAVAGVGGHGHD